MVNAYEPQDYLTKSYAIIELWILLLLFMMNLKTSNLLIWFMDVSQVVVPMLIEEESTNFLIRVASVRSNSFIHFKYGKACSYRST